MPINWTEVSSTNVKQVGYDPVTKELHVAWNSGKRSIYSGVDAKTADQAAKAWSVGKFIAENVKSHYPHRYAD